MAQERSNRPSFFTVALLVFLGLMVFKIVWSGGSTGVGSKFPPLTVAGWVNGPGPTSEELAGKVVVVDCFASWCGPCVAGLPGLAELHPELKAKGIVLIGLTSEPGGSLPSVVRVLENSGATWPVAFGAEDAFTSLGVRSIPRYFVFNRKGVSVWSSHGHTGLMQAVSDALAEGG